MTSEQATVIDAACSEDSSAPSTTMIETDRATDDIPSTISTPATQSPSAITATELLREIIANIQDRPALAACMRVSNKFYHITAPYLYERIDLDNTGSKLFLGCPKEETSKATAKREPSSGRISKEYLLGMTKVITLSCRRSDTFMTQLRNCTAHLSNLKTLRVIEQPATNNFEGLHGIPSSDSRSWRLCPREDQQLFPESVTKIVLDLQHINYDIVIGSYARRRDWLLGMKVDTVVATIRVNEFKMGPECLIDPWQGAVSGTIRTIKVFVVGFDGVLGLTYKNLVWWLEPLVGLACGDSGWTVRVYIIPDEHSLSDEKTRTGMQSALERHLERRFKSLPHDVKLTFRSRADYLAEGIDDEIDPAELSRWRYQEIKLRARLAPPCGDHTEQHEPETRGAGGITS